MLHSTTAPSIEGLFNLALLAEQSGQNRRQQAEEQSDARDENWGME